MDGGTQLVQGTPAAASSTRLAPAVREQGRQAAEGAPSQRVTLGADQLPHLGRWQPGRHVTTIKALHQLSTH